MPGPVTGPCGGIGQPACKPTNAATVNGVKYWTEEQVEAHGWACYNKARVDVKVEMLSHPADNAVS